MQQHLSDEDLMRMNEERIYHLDYIKDRHFATWEELICLSKAIGLPDKVLVKDCQRFCKCKESGVDYSELKEMVKNNEFQESMGYTYNNHSFDWNGGLITMGFRSISHKFITFDDLRKIRLAFTFYEEEDGHGLLCDLSIIIKTLKSSGRIISPMMLKYRLYHIGFVLRVKNRLQIAEFLEIVVWCHLYIECESQIQQLTINNSQTKRKLYQLSDFMDFLKSKDARIHEMLDQKFLMDYWHLLQEKHSKKKSFLEHPILAYIRVAQTTKNEAFHAPMKEAIQESQFAHRLGRPQSAAVILQKVKEDHQRVTTTPRQMTLAESFQVAFTRNGRRLTASEMMTPYIKEVRPSAACKEVQTDNPQTKLMKRPKTAPCVTQKEREIVAERMVALKFDIDMLPRRYDDYVVNDLEYIRPGFWTRKSKRTKPIVEPPPPPKPKTKKRPSDEFLKRISSAPLRQPTPCHGKICDSRYKLVREDDQLEKQFKAREINIRALSGNKVQLFGRVRQSKESIKRAEYEYIPPVKEDTNPLYTLLDNTLNHKKTPLLVVSGSESFNSKNSCSV